MDYNLGWLISVWKYFFFSQERLTSWRLEFWMWSEWKGNEDGRNKVPNNDGNQIAWMDYMDLVVPGTWNDEWNISGHDFATVIWLIFKDNISCKCIEFEIYYVYSGKAAMRCYWTVTALHHYERRHIDTVNAEGGLGPEWDTTFFIAKPSQFFKGMKLV